MACREHQLRDVVVVIERTGRYHLPVKRAFVPHADFEVRILDPWPRINTARSNTPANKTDDIDLGAIHAAAVHGFGLVPVALPPVFLELRDRERGTAATSSARRAAALPDPRSSAQPHAGIRRNLQ